MWATILASGTVPWAPIVAGSKRVNAEQNLAVMLAIFYRNTSVTRHWAPLCQNITFSTETDVYNISQCRQKKDRARTTCDMRKKFGKVHPCGLHVM